jgi:hypothetical protein
MDEEVIEGIKLAAAACLVSALVTIGLVLGAGYAG